MFVRFFKKISETTKSIVEDFAFVRDQYHNFKKDAREDSVSGMELDKSVQFRQIFVRIGKQYYSLKIHLIWLHAGKDLVDRAEKAAMEDVNVIKRLTQVGKSN